VHKKSYLCGDKKIFQEIQGLLYICSARRREVREVTRYFWKKEYQSRGGAHYHVFLWIKDAPLIGKSLDEDMNSK